MTEIIDGIPQPVNVGENYVKAIWFDTAGSGTTSGTIAKPAGGGVDVSFVMDEWGTDTDALVSTMAGGKPTYESPVDSGGNTITTTFNTAGEYALSGTPVPAGDHAIIYVYKCYLKNYDADESLVGFELITGHDHSTLVNLDADDHLQYLRTDGTRELSADWGLGNTYGISEVPYLDFSLSATPGHAEARLHWNAEDGTLECDLTGGVVKLQIGQEQVVRCRNDSGSDIGDGKAVYVSGVLGERPKIELADASTGSGQVPLGLTTEPIADGAQGYVCSGGLVRDIDTSAISVGGIAFLDESTPGEFRATPPDAPNYTTVLGYCIKSDASDGIMFVRVLSSPRMQSLSDTDHTAPSADNFYRWNVGNARFELAGDSSIDHGNLSGLANEGDHLASTIEVGELGTATYDDVQDFINQFGQRTIISGFEMTDAADGSIDVAAGTAWGKVVTGINAAGVFFDFAGGNTVTVSGALADGANNFIYVDYNGGSPQIVHDTTGALLAQYDHIVLGQVFRHGTHSHILEGGETGLDIGHKTKIRFFQQFGATRTSGLVTSETGTRQLAITAGAFWYGLTRLTTPLADTSSVTQGTATATTAYRLIDSGASFTTDDVGKMVHNTTDDSYAHVHGYVSSTEVILASDIMADTENYDLYSMWRSWYYDGDLGTPAWVETDNVTQVDNANWNDVNTGLDTLTANRYAVHWLYLDYGASHFHMVYGQGDYTIAQALSAQIPSSLPPLMTTFALLIARIIVQEGQDTLTIDYPWGSEITASGAEDHGNLAGLGDDDHPQYIKDSEFTAVDKVLVGTGASAFEEHTIGIADDNIVEVDDADAADDDYAKFTARGLEGRSYAEVRSDINVADGADVTGANAPQAHAASHTDGSDDIQSATNAQKGVATAAHITAIEANTAAQHTEGDDQALGSLGTKNPPIDADKAIYRDSTASDALVTSTWTQVKAFLKTYFDGVYHALTTVGIADNNLVEMDDADAADNDYAKFTANGLEGRSYAEVKQDLSLDNVENTQHSVDAHTMSIDGRDVSVDGTKLDGIATGADVTGDNAPQAHAASHVDGSDDIQSATDAQKGLATAAQITKLDAIEALADVTDAVNIASSIVGVADKATPVGADSLGLIDSAAGNALKELTITNLFTALAAVFDTVYSALIHATRHESGGADPIQLDDLAAPSDNTDLDVSTSAHGLCPKLDNVATNFLNGQGGFTEPGGGGGLSATALPGLIIRPKFTHKDDDEIYVDAGVYHHQGTTEQFVYWDSQLTLSGSFGFANSWYYLYLDDSAIVTAGTDLLTASEFLFSSTGPTYSQANHGWYNGSDRCIFAVRTDATADILEFYQESDLAFFADSITDYGQDVDAAWEDVTLTIPTFCTEAEITFRLDNTGQGSVQGSYWRQNGQTGTLGHYVQGTDADGKSEDWSSFKVHTDTLGRIEVRNTGTQAHSIYIYTVGYYFPAGM